MESVTGQSDGAPPIGIQYEISVVYKAVPLPLSRLTGVLAHIELLMIELQQPRLGGYNHYPQLTPKPPPQVRALREPSPIGEAEHLLLCL